MASDMYLNHLNELIAKREAIAMEDIRRFGDDDPGYAKSRMQIFYDETAIVRSERDRLVEMLVRVHQTQLYPSIQPIPFDIPIGSVK